MKGDIPDDPQAQADLMFDNLAAVLEAVGGRLADVLKVTVWLRSDELRPIINAGWLRSFPDPQSRPARHVLIYDLPPSMAIQCEALAVLSDANKP